MKTIHQNQTGTGNPTDPYRRAFLKKGALYAGFAGTIGLNLLGCKEEEGKEAEVSPAEDLMREHGLLSRVLLIYDTCRHRLGNGEDFPLYLLGNAAQIIQSFIENYHEKLEENYLFPRMTDSNQLVDLVQVLSVQHKAGRTITDQIIQLGNINSLDPEDVQKYSGLLESFNAMYRPHAAREDTILFPAFKSLLSKNEYDELGEQFEDREHELFGEEGFESVVEQVAGIERELGIYDLSQFTPA